MGKKISQKNVNYLEKNGSRRVLQNFSQKPSVEVIRDEIRLELTESYSLFLTRHKDGRCHPDVQIHCHYRSHTVKRMHIAAESKIEIKCAESSNLVSFL